MLKQKELKIKKILLASVILVSPFIVMAAPVAIDIIYAGKTFHCVSNGVKIDPNGRMLVKVEKTADLDCLAVESVEQPVVEQPVVEQPVNATGLEREDDIEEKFNTYYPSYNNKAQLNPKTLPNDKKLYIVNPGFSATSIPSCVNGKAMENDCSPTGWTMGMKSQEIYALRQMTQENYSVASIVFRGNLFANGWTVNGKYKVNIAKRAGDMTSNDYQGRCKLSTHGPGGDLYIASPEGDFAKYSYYCKIPVNEAFYLNIELDPSAYDWCDKEGNTCSDYIYPQNLKYPEGL